MKILLDERLMLRSGQATTLYPAACVFDATG